MRLQVMAVLVLIAGLNAQQLPCELVPEGDFPKCRFTARSNHGFRGLVRTVRVSTNKLARDPRLPARDDGKSPKLSIMSGTPWLVFNVEGDVTENAGSVSPDGIPIQPIREGKSKDGTTEITTSGPPDSPAQYRTERRAGSEGRIETRIYQRGKLIARQVETAEKHGQTVEVRSYNEDGALSHRSIVQHDTRGRPVDMSFYEGDRLRLHQVDRYDESSSADDASALFSRAWYDHDGSLISEIILRKGEIISWWLDPKCTKQCFDGQNRSVGFNFAFDRAVNYEIQQDGSLLKTIETHKGRYGNIENDEVILLDQTDKVLEELSFRYVRDRQGNWTERIASVMDPSTGLMIEVQRDVRQLTYY